MKVGYARVSTSGQTLDIQIQKLRDGGCEKIFQEKASAASACCRPELIAALDYVREGDIFQVSRLDRQARSVIDLSQIARSLENKHVDLVVIDQSIDTTTAAGRLLFNMLGAIAEFERELIRERANDGRVRAKAAGVKFGAKPKLSPQQLIDLRREFAVPGENKKHIASRFGVSRATAYRLTKFED